MINSHVHAPCSDFAEQITFISFYYLVLPHGFEPCRSSPSDQSPVFIKHRRLPKLRSILLIVSRMHCPLSLSDAHLANLCAGVYLQFTNKTWWNLLDSNQRAFWEQIYSLSVSATHPKFHVFLVKVVTISNHYLAFSGNRMRL